jgi:hypothetical protein
VFHDVLDDRYALGGTLFQSTDQGNTLQVDIENCDKKDDAFCLTPCQCTNQLI